MAALGTPLRRHRAITHVSVAATALAIAVGIAIPAAPAIQASLASPPRQGSILPANLGVGVGATDAVVLDFPGPMDRAAASAALGISPGTDVSLLWNLDASEVALVPNPRWAVDERYVIYVPAGTAMADGGALTSDWKASFTTQTAPRVFQLLVSGADGTPTADTPIVTQQVMASVGDAEGALSAATDDVASDASVGTAVGLTFGAAMDHDLTEQVFRLTPAVTGTFHWDGSTMWFVPDQRLASGTRYAVSVAGARDADGNRLGGDTSFSFTTRAGAQAIAVTPAIGAAGVTGQTVTITFSQRMDPAPTTAAFVLVDAATGGAVGGVVSWSADDRTLTFTADAALALGRAYAAQVGVGARDADGNPLTYEWRFTTASPARAFIPLPATPGSSDMVQYALNQLNAARAAYGFAPLALDSSISAVAYGHAADMLANGYFSHDSLDGTTYKQRLTAGGISYGWSGENQCYLRNGGGVQATLDWCQAAFWAEPYPGGGNHKDNILNPNYRRVGIGIAVGAGMVIVVWDYTD